MFAVIGGAAIACPIVAPYPPNEIDPLNALAPPSLQHLFGTDDVGRDVFSRSLYGARLDLLIIALMTGISLLLVCYWVPSPATPEAGSTPWSGGAST